MLQTLVNFAYICAIFHFIKWANNENYIKAIWSHWRGDLLDGPKLCASKKEPKIDDSASLLLQIII